MARPLRLQYPGAVYHLTSRGNRQETIFLTDADRVAFLEILGKTVKRYNWICHAYCLMDNHYHLLIETPDANLSLGMRQLNGMFTQYSNRTHHKTGHVFQGRFKSIVVEKNAHLLELCRYIVLNPVRANICDHPANWPWSSYRTTATGKDREEFLTVNWILNQFDNHRSRARERYAEFVLEGCANPPAPWKKLRAQVVYGSDCFMEDLQKYFKGQNQTTEVPKRQRHAGRPQLTALLPDSIRKNKQVRNASIVKAHLDFGYTLKQIADHLGLHYSTVSRIVASNS